MKPYNTAIVTTLCAGAMAFAVMPSVVHADSINDNLAAAPSADSGETLIASDTATSSATFSYASSLNYSMTNGVGTPSSGIPKTFIGETFTTGSSSYTLDSISMYEYNQYVGGSGGNDAFNTNTNFKMAVFNPEAGSGSYYLANASNGGTKGSSNTWAQWVFTSGPTLQANTTYAFTWFLNGGNNNFSEMGLVANGSTASQGLATFPGGTNTSSGSGLTGIALNTTPTYWTGTGASAASSSTLPAAGTGDDAIFEVIGTVAVPEPATLAMLASAGLGLLLIGRGRTGRRRA